MRITIENNKITVPLDYMFEGMTAEQKREIAVTLACESEIIKHVADQILDGWTEDGSYGAKSCDAANPGTALDRATREVAMRSGEVAAREIERLTATIARCEDRLSEEKREREKLRRQLGEATRALAAREG